jgi:hypothetical protein
MPHLKVLYKKTRVAHVGKSNKTRMITLGPRERFIEVIEGAGFVETNGGCWDLGKILTGGTKASSVMTDNNNHQQSSEAGLNLDTSSLMGLKIEAGG